MANDVDISRFRLGRLPKRYHPNTLRAAKYFHSLLPSPATKVYREYKVPDNAKQTFGNDKYGDCVWAMLANFIILTSCHTDPVTIIPTEEQVLEAYAAVTGFDPTTGANDNGTVMTDALEYMRTTGLDGQKILGWAQIDHTNLAHRQLGVDLFGATLVGVNFPASAMDQFNSGLNWELVKDSPLDGGHAIIHPGYGRQGDDYGTWAKWDQKASAAWSYAYIDEEYVAILPSWFDLNSGKTPGELDVNALWADLKALQV